MKNHLFLWIGGLCLMLSPVRAAEEHTALENQMESMDDAFKGFRRETDPVKGAAQAREAQVSALKSAMELPAMVKAMPDGPEKAKASTEYRKMMGKLFVAFCEVEEAFLGGKMEDVTTIVNTLKDMKKAGHDKFIKEE
jgi:hypothetical protein